MLGIFIDEAFIFKSFSISPVPKCVHRTFTSLFKIISIMFVGLGAGYLLRDLKLMRKTEKTIPLTVFAMLFILGISVGSNNLIVSNLGRFSGQAALLACFSVLGSIIAAWLVYYLFFRKGGE